MPERSQDSPGKTDLTTFVTTKYYVVGAGESVTEIRANGEWLATDNPVDVRR